MKKKLYASGAQCDDKGEVSIYVTGDEYTCEDGIELLVEGESVFKLVNVCLIAISRQQKAKKTKAKVKRKKPRKKK
jgi:hypothetical protein